MLGDVIKNNFLEDPPLPLIRAEDDIKETWENGILENSTPSWKISNLEKLSHGLNEVITFIKDIINLAEHHKIN